DIELPKVATTGEQLPQIVRIAEFPEEEFSETTGIFAPLFPEISEVPLKLWTEPKIHVEDSIKFIQKARVGNWVLSREKVFREIIRFWILPNRKFLINRKVPNWKFQNRSFLNQIFRKNKE